MWYLVSKTTMDQAVVAELLKNARLDFGDGPQVVTKEEKEKLERGTTTVPTVSPPSAKQPQNEFHSVDGRVEVANKWAHTDPTKLTNTKDPFRNGTQRWAVVTVVQPPQSNCKAVKVSGCFSAQKKACARRDALNTHMPYMNAVVQGMYSYVPYPVNTPKQAESLELKRHALDKDLMEVMTCYHKQEDGYRQKQLKRMQQAKSDGASGEYGPVQEEFKDPLREDESSTIIYNEMDPLEDAPTLLQPAAQDIEDEQEGDEGEDAEEDTGSSKKARELGSAYNISYTTYTSYRTIWLIRAFYWPVAASTR